MIRSWSSFLTASADGGGESTGRMGLVVGEDEVVESVVGVGGTGRGLPLAARDTPGDALGLIGAIMPRSELRLVNRV